MEVKFKDSETNLCGKTRIATIGSDKKFTVSLFLDKGLTKLVTLDDDGNVHSQFVIETGVLLDVADAIREELKRG